MLSGLRFRTTVAYTLTTLVAVLLVETLVVGIIWLALHYGGLADEEFLTAARGTAQMYALESAIQAAGDMLDPRTTFEPGQPFSIALTDKVAANHPTQLPYLTPEPADPDSVPFALLFQPGGKVLASSYPARYAAMTSADQLAQSLPYHANSIAAALNGTPASSAVMTAQGRIVWAVEPVWSRTGQTIGAVYLQIPVSKELISGPFLPGFARVLLASGVFWLVLMIPVGGLFGFLTTRGLLKRLHKLMTATTRFADGDYTQRVTVSRRDEVGQLEAHFNRMAEQLVTSISERQGLAEENARLAERNRIARDLHDSVKQQIFAVSMQLGAALTAIEIQPDKARQHMLEADSLSYRVQEELTALIQQLRPAALQSKGLASALQEYVTAWGIQQGIAVHLQLDRSCLLTLPVEEALWRVAQEALFNIERHSGANEVHVTLTCQQERVTLSISDNGQGFDPQAVKGSNIGLSSMRERMQALDGMFFVYSNIGEGTKIVAESSLCPVRPLPSAIDQNRQTL